MEFYHDEYGGFSIGMKSKRGMQSEIQKRCITSDDFRANIHDMKRSHYSVHNVSPQHILYPIQNWFCFMF